LVVDINDRWWREGKEQMELKISESGMEEQTRQSDRRVGDNPCKGTRETSTSSHPIILSFATRLEAQIHARAFSLAAAAIEEPRIVRACVY
jgi:hypothetical protein